MKIQEIILEDASAGSTSSGSVATVAAPLAMISRSGILADQDKYFNGPWKHGNQAVKKTKGKNRVS